MPRLSLEIPRLSAEIPRLSVEEEARRIIDVYGRDHAPSIVKLMEGQFAVLTNRSQLLLALCGIIISTSSIAGRFIASTNRVAQALVISGVGIVLSAAIVVCVGVLHLHWLTQHRGETLDAWLARSLIYRDRKTRLYRIGLMLLLVGMGLYVGALLAMLVYPEAAVSLPRTQ